MKLAKGSFNNIFQDSFNKILSQQLTHDRILYISDSSVVQRETNLTISLGFHCDRFAGRIRNSEGGFP